MNQFIRKRFKSVERRNAKPSQDPKKKLLKRHMEEYNNIGVTVFPSKTTDDFAVGLYYNT